MPVIINDDNSVQQVSVTGAVNNAVTTTYTPKFFHKTILTGKGGTSKGLLNEKNDPKMFLNGYRNVNQNMSYGTVYGNNDIKMYQIPCSIIGKSLWDQIRTFERPDLVEMTKVASKNNTEVYLTMPIYCVQIEEQTMPGPAGSSSTTTVRRLDAVMHEFLFVVENANVKEHTQTSNWSRLTNPRGDNYFFQDTTQNIFTTLRYIESEFSKAGFDVDRDALEDFKNNYSIYTELCKASEKWQTKADYYIADVLIKNMHAITNGDPNHSVWSDNYYSVPDVLSRLEKYNVPLDSYHIMYQKMTQYTNDDILAKVCKNNLNLKLANTLQNMDKNRALLEHCPCTKHIQTTIPFSREQREAIESDSPLTLVQSGAGTGKSTVILGRIDHMIANGVNPDDITVLSFTNAAADHITDLKPTIHSMTIASMLHAIYSNNFPKHMLSSLSTIINSLEIYFDSSTNPVQKRFADDFKYILERLRDNKEYTRADNFIEEHIDEVIDVLDVIGQTSLELESIICYQKMETLVEPPETKTKHLIIDEVQDNSIAEFIYSVKYTDKHHCSLYIVGDCSQTLYEFRSSNPKALNVLENSGVFATYKLQTNYRSNQEILDFANVMLDKIEANQYANIQLKANSLRPITAQSFQDAVQIHYELLKDMNPNTINNMLNHSIAIDTAKFIQDKIDKKEQVCILAHKRATLFTLKKALEHKYPQLNIVDIIPDAQKDGTLFSKFIAKYWDNVQYTPPTNIVKTIRSEMFSKIQWLVSRSAKLQNVQTLASKVMDDFENEYGSTILNWQTQVMNSVMTQAELLDNVKKAMIEFEIKSNSVRQAVISARNAKDKNSDDVENADIILSTIHSAKGLEWDNVIVYYKSESEAAFEESDKRMYYVAFTRAKKAEMIFAYGRMVKPKIQGDYAKIVLDLTNAATNNANGTATGNTSGDDNNDDNADSTDVVVTEDGNGVNPSEPVESPNSNKDDSNE